MLPESADFIIQSLLFPCETFPKVVHLTFRVVVCPLEHFQVPLGFLQESSLALARGIAMIRGRSWGTRISKGEIKDAEVWPGLSPDDYLQTSPRNYRCHMVYVGGLKGRGLHRSETTDGALWMRSAKRHRSIPVLANEFPHARALVALALGTWNAYDGRALSPCPQNGGGPRVVQGSLSESYRYIVAFHSRGSSLNHDFREILLHFAHSDGYTPYKVQKPSLSEKINSESHEAEDWTTY